MRSLHQSICTRTIPQTSTLGTAKPTDDPYFNFSISSGVRLKMRSKILCARFHRLVYGVAGGRHTHVHLLLSGKSYAGDFAGA